jgi:hypothetical protein
VSAGCACAVNLTCVCHEESSAVTGCSYIPGGWAGDVWALFWHQGCVPGLTTYMLRAAGHKVCRHTMVVCRHTMVTMDTIMCSRCTAVVACGWTMQLLFCLGMHVRSVLSFTPKVGLP